MNNLCTEVGYVSLNKRGEQLCGDRVEIANTDDSTILVLADGLGSGVKANILSTLTSKILCTMLAGGMPIEACVETMASTLPVCQIRKVAYSTFTTIKVTRNRIAELVQFDNPQVILLRDGRNVDYPYTTRTVADKVIYESRIAVDEGDVFIAMSDGAGFAGIGDKFSYGWQREGILDFAQQHFQAANSAKLTATTIIDECERLYDGKPGDDTTIAVIKIRDRYPVNMMIGPPSSRDQDMKMLNLFFAKQGEKIVCGGTTSNLAAHYLGHELQPSLDYFDPDIPPTCTLDGCDLVTEGVITISRVLQYAQAYLDTNASPDPSPHSTPHWSTSNDGTSLLARKLFEQATDINFFVGRAINPAHQNPDLPITFGIKIQLIESLAKCLERMGKQIKVSYF